MRRRATSGEMARGGLVFVFSLEVAPVSGVGAGARGGFNPLRGATTGVVMRRRATSGEMARGGFWFGGFFCGWTGSRCGSMCWPVDRPATHAAAGAAARGALIFCFGGFFHTLGSGWHERVRGGGFNPLRGATTGVVMRRRATSGEMARGGWFLFFLWRLLRCRRGILSHAREWTAREG